MEQSKNALKELNQMQSMFIDLAQQVHHIRTVVDYEITGPPFDGYTYVWNWNGITILFCSSNFYFLIIFDLSRYISPACAEYSLIVHEPRHSRYSMVNIYLLCRESRILVNYLHFTYSFKVHLIFFYITHS